MSLIQFSPHADFTHELEVVLSTEERLYQLAAEHDESRVFAVYHAITRAIRERGGWARLSHQQVADITPGCGRNKAGDIAEWLADADLLDRDGDGHSAYTYRLPPPQPRLQEVHPHSPGKGGRLPRKEGRLPGVTKLEEEKEEIIIDRDNGESVTQTPDNEQVRIARQFVTDPTVIALAAKLDPDTVKHIAEKARGAGVGSPANYFAYSVRHAPPKQPRKPKPAAPARTATPGKYDAFMDDGTNCSELPNGFVDELPADPTGPVVMPEPATPPPPPESEVVTHIRTMLQLHMRSDYHALLASSRLVLNGDTLTITAPNTHTRDQLAGRWHRFLVRYVSDAVGRDVGVVAEYCALQDCAVQS